MHATAPFTPREKQIAIRLLKGEKRAAMASGLGIEVRTVDFHLTNLRRKVRVNSLIELAIYCARLNGVLSGKQANPNAAVMYCPVTSHS